MADLNHTNSTSSKPRRGSVRTHPAPRSPQMTIVVAQDIIDTAEQSNSRSCMIAEAIRATLPYAANILVDAATIRWTNPDKGLRYVFLTPMLVRTAIASFDRGSHVESFSFHLRSAHVIGVGRRDGAQKRMTAESWEKVKESIKKIRSERGLKWEGVAREMDIAPGTLMTRIYDHDIPTERNATKIEKWVLKHTGDEPAPRIKSQAKLVAGPAQFRSPKSTKREQPEIVGGNPPPVSTTWRQFGLRMFSPGR